MVRLILETNCNMGGCRTAFESIFSPRVLFLRRLNKSLFFNSDHNDNRLFRDWKMIIYEEFLNSDKCFWLLIVRCSDSAVVKNKFNLINNKCVIKN